ncbi:uncharacterized protein LOC116337637 [Contarinia nasturtii]|uniref:uncharacterized protein LOC116337637 n=1 Tax=Contarinia nasturtii TaxID=265458 RepID=UPI0012D3743D|nr:uncharacterized protein LOC116337637 [Contarinia nasturtii]
MDVINSNSSDGIQKKKQKRPRINAKIKQFSIEIYFMWFSALIFFAETFVDFMLVCCYFVKNEVQYGVITLTLVIVPSVLCQIYSLWLLRSDSTVSARALMMHILLLGIPYRYQNILHKISRKDKSMSDDEEHTVEVIIDRIRDVNAIQTVNAIFQYCPQFLFQSFLIVYRHYKYLMTGVSAGLAVFSFLWHIFIHFFYLIRRFNEDYKLNVHSTGAPTRSTTHIIDNLSSSHNSNSQVFLPINGTIDSNEATVTPIIDLPNVIDASNLPEDLKTFEKASYKTDMKNFVESKKHGVKNVEKTKMFGFNKRQPIYEHEEFDMMCDSTNFSTIFFEVNDSNYMTSSKLDNSRISSSTQTEQPKLREMCKSMDDLQQSSPNKAILFHKLSSSTDNLKQIERVNSSADDSPNCLDSMQNISDSRNSLLKRKGICSSQEMLHLVDIMSDHISAEQVDVLAKSLIELGGAESSRAEAEQKLQDLDRVSLLERLPEIIDDKLIENIDAAIYENQIIFQERIRKNQLTIQNLKLQDQLLSKYIEDFKLLPGDGMSVCDYENMCFANIAQQTNGIKHWRNYLQDIDTNQHDDSTMQHSSFYMHTNTISNSFTDLYINENDFGSTASGQFTDKNVSTLVNATSSNLMNYSCDDDETNENYYMNMTKGTNSLSPMLPYNQCQKNILVQTINKINHSVVDSPIIIRTKSDAALKSD